MNKKIGKYVEEGITAIIGNDLDTAKVYLNHASNHEKREFPSLSNAPTLERSL